MDAGIFDASGNPGSGIGAYSIILSNPASPAASKYAAFIGTGLTGTVGNQTTVFDYS